MKEVQNEAIVFNLVEAFRRGDQPGVAQAVEQLGVPKEGDLYQRIGEMARTLHSSLGEFQKSLRSEQDTMASTSLPLASEKLKDVLEMTFDASDCTLEGMERLQEIADTQDQRRKELYRVCTEGDAGRLRELLLHHLDCEHQEREERRQIFETVIQAQSFQDLTGQALKKVMGLVTDLENKLVRLVQFFGREVQAWPSPIERLKRARRLPQDEVDKILKDFGF